MRRLNARSRAFDPPPTAEMPPESSKLHRRPNPIPSSSLRSLWIPFYFLAPMALLTYLFFPTRDHLSPKFSIIIDGGSTGSRIHVFVYRNRSGSFPEIYFQRTEAMKVIPGLSFYSRDPNGAAESLGRLLDFGKEKVPKERWRDTDVRLMATGGLRMLDGRTQDQILEACRLILRTSGFLFEDDWAQVIPGADEGIFAWVAANYALGTLGGSPQKTAGIIELGGASAQVAFVSSTELLIHDFSHVVKFGDMVYNLYSQSFLHLGQNVAYESLHQMLSSRDPPTSAKSRKGNVSNPCVPRGYSFKVEPFKVSSGILDTKKESHFVPHAIGNFSECRSAALMLLGMEKAKCASGNCHHWSALVPKLHGKFIATENFFYTTKFFRLESTSSLSDLVFAGQQFCGEGWSKISKEHNALEDEDLARFCFSAAYIVALLHDNLGIDMNEKRIRFANQIGGIPVDWAVGAFIMLQASNQTNGSSWIPYGLPDDSPLLSLIAVSSLLVLAVWSLCRWRKPRLKTIYDLEKGKYIITRVRR